MHKFITEPRFKSRSYEKHWSTPINEWWQSPDFKVIENIKLLNCPWIDKEVFENLEWLKYVYSVKMSFFTCPFRVLGK